MQNYKITIQYDGTKYNGWQKQKNTTNTIQEKIENVLTKFTGNQVEIFASGRTDAGVHAIGQVANFKIKKAEHAHQIKKYLNEYLPSDINILDIKEVSDRFHSRLSCKGKTYLYRIYTGEKVCVFDRKYVYSKQLNLDINKMNKAKEFLIGKKDFISFSSIKKSKKSTVRTIFSIDIEEENGEFKFIFCGNGFLYNMVRIIVGTLIEVGQGYIKLEEIEQILNSKNRQLAGKTMPPQGLFLYKVHY